MAVPVSQMWTVASYVLRKKLKGEKRYPLVLMLEPLFRCNLACAGCGKIQYPAHVLKRELTPEECVLAAQLVYNALTMHCTRKVAEATQDLLDKHGKVSVDAAEMFPQSGGAKA